jgi:two-component system, NarL family, response regulator LiaR
LNVQSDPPSTRLLIYALATLQREAWRALLSNQPGITIGGVLTDPEHLAALLQPDLPTTLLIDLPKAQPDLIRSLKDIGPNLGLLIFVQSYDLSEIIPLLTAGAAGCISRDESVGDLARAIIAAGRGEIVLPPAMAMRALTALARGEPIGPARSAPIEPLTEREVEVLRLLAQGLTNKDIAQTLILSVRTIDAHLRSIFGKLNVRSRTEAALWAARNGYGPEK